MNTAARSGQFSKEFAHLDLCETELGPVRTIVSIQRLSFISILHLSHNSLETQS